MTTDIKVKAPKRKKSASLDKRKARGGWLFVLPFVIGFILIYLPIVIDSIRYSFYTIKVLAGGGFELIPAGWNNYNEALFVNPDFVETLIQGLGDMVFDIPMILIFSLFMAVLLNQKMAGRAVFRAIFFIPVIISTGIVGTIEAQNTAGDYMESAEGIDDGSGTSTASEIVSAMDVEAMFSGMAVGQGLVEYVTTAINNIYDIVNRSGVQMLIFLAGLQSISPAIYESVQIDGATSWETFWKITFPMISPMILVNAVYTIIDSFTAESNVVMSFISGIYQQANGNVVSSAMSWMYFLIVIAIIAIVAAVFSAFVFYQRRD
ncbi:MAG: sugar ABC transporter permease [Clostridia bacterium]|nr:sugar ABC transporter permease [Clostridia bacterium]MBR4012902.1 sugar ABC transporter permease [Clostridia bacterium]